MSESTNAASKRRCLSPAELRKLPKEERNAILETQAAQAEDAYRTDVLFHAGDVFRITVNGSAVTYALNGVTFYTSSTVPASPLIATIVLATAGASVQNATLGGGS